MSNLETLILVTIIGKPREGHGVYCQDRFQSPTPNNGLCIPNDFSCDGQNDCDPLENWDEGTNCTAITCTQVQFKRNSTQTCIPSRYGCDGDGDCDDETDKLGCNK